WGAFAMGGPLGAAMRGVAVAMLLAGTLVVAGCATPSSSTAVDAAPARGLVKVVPQRNWSDAVLYFVILDRFADGDGANDDKVDRNNPGGWHGGDLKGLTAQLDEIASLGATALWITPVVKQIDYCPPSQAPVGVTVPGGWFEHCAFHGYWADDFTKLDPHYGSEADLKALVDAAHARGMKVLLDVVYNHVGYDASYTKNPATKDWIRTKPVDCAEDALHCQVGGLPDLRTELPAVQDYLLAAQLGLAKRTGLDGFRLDTVKHVEHEFWQRHRQETRAQLGHDFFLLAEVWGGSATVLDEYFAPDEMDAGFDFTFKGSCESFVQGKGRTIAFASYLEKRYKVRAGHYLAHYLSSHDEPMALANLGGDKDAFKLCVALQMTSLGIPTIYYGEEVARAGGAWPLNRGDMPWGKRAILPGKGIPRDEDMRAYYRRLIELRRENVALSAGDFKKLSADSDLLVFERNDAATGNAVVVAVNRGQVTITSVVDAPQAWGATAKVTEALTGATVGVDLGRIAVTVPARTARVYIKKT
ncbi:MAG TPA: alpha-amylase family glycosyl hydrolase, partial [Steroidobacteraceae bacterium]